MTLRYIKLLSGPVAAALILMFADLQPGNPATTRMAAVTAWIALWWLTEAVEMAVTSLLPVVLMPALGIMEMKTVALQYMDQVIFLFMGGFIIAFALEKWNLHRRISLYVLSLTGRSAVTLLAGIMGVTYIISMWMSNTATTLLLLPAVIAVCDFFPEDKGKHPAAAIMIGLAYAASIGGMATLVGTPTNMIFYSYYTAAHPGDTSVNFASWFAVGLPVSMLLLVTAFFSLWFFHLRGERNLKFDRTYFKETYKQLGRMTTPEKIVSVIFGLTAVLWFTRADLDFGAVKIPGWGNLFEKPNMIQDSTVAIAMAILLFFIPSGDKTGKDKVIMRWDDVQKLPLGILLLFGAGFALAAGFESSGLSAWIATQMQFVKGMPYVLLILSIAAIICVISEFASNVASIQLALPILAAMQPDTGVSPLALMIPATIAASLGFMLPVATAPNTIVFSSGKVPVNYMMRAGLLIDIAGILIIALLAWVLY